MKTLLIINPESGQLRAALEKRRLLNIVSETSNFHTEFTTDPEDALTLAQKAARCSFERIIAAGGDGTVNQVINGIGDSGIPLGILPVGTVNVLARDLGIPVGNVYDALSIINAGVIREVDVGLANNKRFILMAGIGIDAEVVNCVSQKVKDLFGPLAYASAVIEQLAKYNAAHFRLSFDTDSVYETDAFAVVVANSSSYAYNLKIAPHATFDDGLLDIIVFEKKATAKLGLISQALKTVFQQQLSDSGITYFRAAGVKVDSDPPVKAQLDGDVYGDSPIDIQVLPKALKLIVP